jgi:hypothetical protein
MGDTMSTETASRPGFFRSTLATIFHGVLLGIGLLIVFATYQRLDRNAAHDEYYGSIAASGDTYLFAGKDYSLHDLREIKENDSVWIVGRIENLRKDRPIRGIELQANLYKGTVFVDQYTESIYGGLKPAEKRLFKISCGCKGNPPAEHDRFEVVVIRAY